ncbi:MAG: ATP-binding cassette domain-containing protein [Alphaproteobacteria bacterium]|nr:ATP-binding cassette domain-containing protein [Alphaproteobacteria bacterium]
MTVASILPLQVRDLRYEVDGTSLIKDISFTLNGGSRTIILGHNGAGKSLLLRLCHGLIPPTGGDIIWRGPAEEPARHQAMVFQRPMMLRRTAAGNVDFALKMRGIPRAERRPLVVDALKQTRLHRHADRQARTLSFGEQQRLALARAWAMKPDILFLDEPTASLDPAVTRSIEDLINLIHDAGTKIVMSTHDLGQARRLADEILFLHRGRLIAHAPAQDILNHPGSEEVRAFIAGELFW